MVAALTIASPSPFGRIWAAYERSLRRRPILTQAVSSAMLWGIGDGLAQRIETHGRGGVDARRVALTAAFGGSVIGPAGHVWYQLLERLVQSLGLACSMKSMLFKVTVDNLIYSPCYVLAFFAYGCMVIDGLSPTAFMEKMREEFVPTMLAEAAVWPPYMAAVFSRVPVKHQLLAVNVATLFDVCFLSWVRCKHHEQAAPAKAAVAATETADLLSDSFTADADQPQTLQAQEDPRVVRSGGEEENVVATAAATVAGAAAAFAVAWSAGLQQQQKGQQQKGQPVLPPPRTAGEARRRELAASMWDAAPEPSLGHMALMAASSTCSTVGGGSRLRVGNAAHGGGTSGGSSRKGSPAE